MSCQVTFSIASPSTIGSDEILGIVGNLDGLGMWNVSRALILNKSELSAGRWEGSLAVNRGAGFKYRYFSGVQTIKQNPAPEKAILVKSCEVHLDARSVTVPDKAKFNIEDDQFGSINGEKIRVDRGWLSEHYEMRCSISSPKNCPFLEFSRSFKQPSGTNLYVHPEACSSVISSTLTAILPYSYSEFSDEFRIEVPKPEEDHYNLTVQTFEPKELCIRFCVSDENGVRIGLSLLSCSTLPTSKGVARLPLLNSQFSVIGSMRVPYLLVKPFSSCLSMERSFTTHWKPRPMVHVGHRGSGNSFQGKKLSNQLENTVASFVQASNSIAQYVEFDVHLTKDEVPIVYHDLTTCIYAQKKGISPGCHLVELPVHSFTVAELQSLNMMHRSRKHSSRELCCDIANPSRDGHPFPTLKEVFEEVPMKTGFNIEVKWPTLDENHEYEDGMEHFFDANLFVDTILKVVFEFAKSRKIIFSCFDVDICIMLRRKQNLYPVLFLTNGDTRFYTPMLDLREATNPRAIGAAKAEGFLGIDTLDRDVYKDAEIVRKAHDAGLIFACYGDGIADNIDVIANSSVDIAIYDRIHETKH